MIEGLRNNFIVTDEEYDSIKYELDKYKDDEFNFEFLKKARLIEEEFYQRKARG
jgi:hypothetical protein